ncbi:Vms1/Ankzf1 family peptidyl-tRNA hydrolase [Natronomonas sp. EA1]|uniref:Vms1/Ankzf1 family peptidyl-tRNA hydrolase n=1 Tax=Natronomonas sp. EA1 TaxID=3421655 RepID=UPI003EC11728
MLDDLLGRTPLKERIAALEEELEHAKRELRAERRRRSEASTAKQEAEERVNRLEDKISGLQGKLKKAKEEGGLRYRRVDELRGTRLTELLDRLTSLHTEPEGALSAYVEDDIPEEVGAVFGDRTPLVERASPCLVYADDEALVTEALDPAVAPEPFVTWGDRFRVERDWFRPAGPHALALVRSDLFALGTYDGRERVSMRGFTTDVKSKHSKGGFSQGRFERIRDGQIHDHLEKCRAAIDELDVRPLYVVGEHALLGEFADAAAATEAVDATGEPEAALDDAHRSFWTTRRYGI